MADTKHPFVLTRLSVMMFLQFFVWGAWYVSMTGFIRLHGMGDLTGAAYMVAPIAAILSPFFLGLIADRFFSSERLLGALHILGGAFLLAAPSAASLFELGVMPENAGIFYKVMLHDLPAFKHLFVLVLLGHMLCYMPTLAVSTSLAFHNLENQEKQFPLVRVLGTIGWIAGNIAVSFLAEKDESASQFYMAGGAAMLLGLYSFTLPHTPAPSKGKKVSFREIVGFDSLALLKKPSFSIFILCSFLICIPLAAYYQQGRNFIDDLGIKTNGSATFTMSFGQMSEIFFMLIMPMLFVRLGVKWMLFIGMCAWVLRYLLFAYGGNPELAAEGTHANDVLGALSLVGMIYFGILLHGICYDFFFVTGMIYVDKAAPSEIRGQAQGFLVLVTQGLGLGIGAKIIFGIREMNTADGVADWQTIWLIPCLMAAVIAAVFFLFFREKNERGMGGASMSEGRRV